MDIHLPKPIHGWRALIGEVGIIVLGVLIALGFGQLAETIHEGTIAAQARDAVRAEVRENLWWLEYRGQREPCIRQRLAQLDDLLARARLGERSAYRHPAARQDHDVAMAGECAGRTRQSLFRRRAAHARQHVLYDR